MNPIFEELRHQIEKRTARLTVIGLGYVGLPMAIEFSGVGYNIVGIDNDPNRVAQLKEGKSYILDVAEKQLQDTIDPHYLSWKLKTLNYSAKFIELARRDQFQHAALCR